MANRYVSMLLNSTATGRAGTFDFDMEIIQQNFAHYCVSISAYRDSKFFSNAEIQKSVYIKD